MKRWILAAIAAVSLILSPALLEAKGSGHSGGHFKSGSHKSKGSSAKSEKKAKTVHVKEHKRKDGTTVRAHDRTAPNSCVSCVRDTNGHILRNKKQLAAFEKASGYPHGRKGFVVDHIVPLECGGADVPSNMQWQTTQAAALKDKTELRCRG